MNHEVALAELVGYSEEACMDALVETVFVLSDMTTLHTTWMEHLGTINRDCRCIRRPATKTWLIVLFQLGMSASYDRVLIITSSQLTLITRYAVNFRENMQFVPFS